MASPGEVSSTPDRFPVVSAIQLDDGTLAKIIEGVTARVQGAMGQADQAGEANWGTGKGEGWLVRWVPSSQPFSSHSGCDITGSREGA